MKCLLTSHPKEWSQWPSAPRWCPTSWGLCKPVTTEGGRSPFVEPKHGATFYDLFPSKIRKMLGVGKPSKSG